MKLLKKEMKMRILLAEDELALSRVIVKILEKNTQITYSEIQKLKQELNMYHMSMMILLGLLKRKRLILLHSIRLVML